MFCIIDIIKQADRKKTRLDNKKIMSLAKKPLDIKKLIDAKEIIIFYYKY